MPQAGAAFHPWVVRRVAGNRRTSPDPPRQLRGVLLTPSFLTTLGVHQTPVHMNAPPILHHELVQPPGTSPDAWLYLLPGIYGAGRNWGSVMRRWVQERPDWGAVLIDLRGHGASQGFSPPHTLESAAADLIVPELTFSFKQAWVDMEGVGAESARGGEFPLIGLAYPVGWGVVTATFAGVLDQRWRTEVQRVLDLGEEVARVTDRFRSEGGVAAARLGLARRVSPSLALGITVGTYTGDVTRTFTRRFDSLAIERNVPLFATGGLWGYSGPTLGLGGQSGIRNIWVSVEHIISSNP